MTPNDRGYGLGRAAGEFPVAVATKEMRAQRLPKAHQPPKAHRRVLCGRSILFFCRLNFGCLKELSLANRFSIPYLNALSARLRTKSDRKWNVFLFSLKSRNKSLQISAIIIRFMSVRIMFVNTFLWNFHHKSSFQSDCFQFVQKILVSLPPANQVLNFFSHCLNALSSCKWEKSKSQNLFYVSRFVLLNTFGP